MRGEDHGRVELAPSLLGPRDPVANNALLEEDPSFVDDEELEDADVLGLLDLRRSSVQDVEQHRLEDIGVLIPATEVEGLEAREGERVLYVVEQIAELAGTRPAMETFAQRPENGREVGKRPDLAREFVDTLQRSVERFFVRGGELVASSGLDQDLEEEIKEVEILVSRFQRERIDAEAWGLQPDVEIGSSEGPRQHLVAGAEIEDDGQRLVLLCRLQQE